MSKVIKKGNIYESGRKINHCLYMAEKFMFEFELKERVKVLIRNGKKVRV